MEGGAGLGKTSLVEAACAIAQRDGRVVLRACGSDLEQSFPFGIARQLFERQCAGMRADERDALFAGPARAVAGLLQHDDAKVLESDTGFAVLHGLYWLSVNFADRVPLLLAVDDAHWADAPSLRWLAYLAVRLAGAQIALLVALRPDEPASRSQPLLAVRNVAATCIYPALLSAEAVALIVRERLGAHAHEEMCLLAHRVTGGNPFYLLELLRGMQRAGSAEALRALEDIVRAGGVDGIAVRLYARLQRLNPQALRLAQALSILGEGCELRHAAAITDMELSHTNELATELVRMDVLGSEQPVRFIHPIVLHAVTQTMSGAQQEAAHRAAARVLYAEGVPPVQLAAHLRNLRSAGDPWVVERLRAAAQAAVVDGAPLAAAELLERALAEPPSSSVRIDVLREAARALQLGGQEGACARLQEAIALTEDRSLRAQLSLELAHAHAALFQWADAVEVAEKALADAQGESSIGLECALVSIGLQDARTAPRALRAMKRLFRPQLSGTAATTLALAQGMLAILTGRPAEEAARPLLSALSGAHTREVSWDMRAALLWSLVTAERFDEVETALSGLRVQAERSRSSRGLFAVHSTGALLKLRVGDLAQADAEARIALRIAQEGDFARGLPFAATVLAEVAIASGQLEEAQALLDLLPHAGLPAGVGTVLIPAARGRMRLAQSRAQEALDEFETCIALWSPDVWGMEVRDVGYTHARAGAALALIALGEMRRAREMAQAELVDLQRFQGPRALGIGLRTAGLAQGGAKGLGLLEESAGLLRSSKATLEYATSLVEWGAALRRAGQRTQSRHVLLEGLDRAARCGAQPLTARAREELRVAGARPRRDWTIGLEALTPSELRIVRLARAGHSNRRIAQQLYLSIKTVEGHLARAYGKLGISRRDELKQVLD